MTHQMAVASALIVLLGWTGASLADGRPSSTTMTGAEETRPADPDGSGEAILTFNPGTNQACVQLSVTNIAPATASHVHRGPAGVAGPPVIGLPPPTDGFSSGCVTADRDLLVEIARDPSEFYVNVHNAEFPAGAIRGQLSR